jgi:hypothetical protein
LLGCCWQDDRGGRDAGLPEDVVGVVGEAGLVAEHRLVAEGGAQAVGDAGGF